MKKKSKTSIRTKRSIPLIIIGTIVAIMSFVIAAFSWYGALAGTELRLYVGVIAVGATACGIMASTAVIKNKPEWLLLGLLIHPL